MDKDSINDPTFQTTAMKWSGVAGVVFIIGVAIATTYYTSTSKNHIINNKNSKNRLTSLDESMRSIMGPKWPYILLTMLILVAMVLYGLYNASSKGNGGINLTLGDRYASTLNKTFITFVIIFGVVMLVMTIHEYKKYQTNQEMGNIPNYEPSSQQKKKDLQIAVIIGGSMLLFIGGGLLIWYLFLGGRDKVNK